MAWFSLWLYAVLQGQPTFVLLCVIDKKASNINPASLECWEEEETSLKEPKGWHEHLFSNFSIFWTFFYYQTTQAPAHDTKSFIWIIFNIQHTYTSIYKTRTMYEQLRTPSRWETTLSYRDGGLPNHYPSHKILQQSLCHWWFYSTCWASHATSFWFSWPLGWILPDAYKSQITSSIQPPSKKIIIQMMLTLTVSHSYFFPDIVLYIMYDSMTKMYCFDLDITVRSSFWVLSLFIIQKQLLSH